MEYVMQQRRGATVARLIGRLLHLHRWQKRTIVLAFDTMLCALSVWFAYYLRLGEWLPIFGPPAMPLVVSIALALPLFITFGLYRTIFRYAELAALLTIVRAIGIYTIGYATVYTVVGVTGVPRTIGLIQPMLLLVLTCTSRALVRAGLSSIDIRPRQLASGTRSRVLIYGAGDAGRQLAGAIKTSADMKLFGFIDDDARLRGATLNGVGIWTPDRLDHLVHARGITDILLAIPSGTRARRTEIVHRLHKLKLHVQTLPAVLDLARGEISINDLKDVEIEDLLGREAVAPDPALLSRNIENKVVLITGAGGSIGSELSRQVAANGPATLLLVDASEPNLYAIHHELASRYGTADTNVPTILPLLASVVDERRMAEIIGTWRPDTIFHAAAYKHVPMVEHNLIEGVRNNVIGTLTVAKQAIAYGVPNFVLISTDKAVRPTNVMGATKRLAEMTLQALQVEQNTTRLSMVRFGNVLGSSGSVVPLFRKQIAAGGPVTITDPAITRYFMTIPEAAQLVLQAGAMATGGDVFVLDMGEPVRIYDLACNMIELSGLSPRNGDTPLGDIEIRVVGLRPGEKLYEELLIGDDVTPTGHPRIMRAQEKMLPWDDLEIALIALTRTIEEGDAARARAILQATVPEYSAMSGLVDWVASTRSGMASTPANV
jgi:FlaA1/EpsC-like NDP-sugar epimerase